MPVSQISVPVIAFEPTVRHCMTGGHSGMNGANGDIRKHVITTSEKLASEGHISKYYEDL